MKTGSKGLSLIKQAEGLRLRAYKCPADVWTIGYGHTRTAREGMMITPEEAESLLRDDLRDAERCINNTGLSFTQNQFDALVSFVYNLGCNAFTKSTLLAKIREGASDDQIKTEFRRWVYSVGKVLKGLVDRREKEIDLYFQK